MAARPSKKKRRAGPSDLPKTYIAFTRRFPAVAEAHEAMALAAEQAGPLDAKTRSLVKVGICVGAGLESALRSHARRALENGATEEEIQQAVLLGLNTVGFPRVVAATSWLLPPKGAGRRRG